MKKSHLSVCLAAATLMLAAPVFAQTSFTANESILSSFPSGYGGSLAGTIQASDGNFYPSLTGNSYIFRVTPAGAFSSLKGQIGSACGINISSGPIEGPDGDLYAMTSNGGAGSTGEFFSYSLTSKTCTALGEVPSNISSPSPMTIGADGNFYFVSFGGGANNSGAAYRVTPAGAFTDLYDFDEGGVSGSPDGANPIGAMLQGSDGNWYGQVRTGVSGSSTGGVFQLVPGATTPWQENIFLDFSGPTGYDPTSQPTEWTDQNLYGTLYGGASSGYGGIWQTDLGDNNPNADYFSFPGGDDQAQSNLFLAGDNNFYSALGNTAGADDGGFFVFDPGTMAFKDVFGFAPGNGDLISPTGPIVQGNDGALYGTGSGGANNSGGIYRIAITPAPKPVISVTATPVNDSGSPVTISWTVREVTSMTAAQCFAYSYAVSDGFNVATSAAGNWSGKLSSTISNFTMSGTATVTPTAVGQYVYAVECQGKIAGLSPVVNVTGLSAAPTTTTLSASKTTINYGAQEVFTATVKEQSGTGVPTGTVTFSAVGQTLATTAVNGSGVATLSANAVGYGANTYPIVATYNGDSGNAKSTSNTVDVRLVYGTTTTLTASPSSGSSSTGTTITLTAKVAQSTGPGSGSTVPTGSVSFYASGYFLGTVNLSNGTAVAVGSTKGFPTGSYSATAVYSGNNIEGTSTSNAVPISVTK